MSEDSSMTFPQRMKWVVKELDNMRKENYSFIPSSGQVPYNAGQKIIIDLPQNSVIDLTTFQMAYKGATTHNGGAEGSANESV